MPRRSIEYRGVTLEEMDVDAIIARKPQVCVVDELAHTNVPGSRHEKRYQDVLEILDAGIHVMTAVNIQHLETLNDAVAKVTGVRVRETVPDTFLERADEVINVDVTVEELRNRLREGKIYKPEKVEQALTNFFRKGNLSTLRELALRAVADEVGEKAASYRAREGLEPALIPERVMVCMSSNALAPRVIRTGARIAGRLGSKWYAVYVETPREQPDRIRPGDADALAAEHPAGRKPGRHRGARQGRPPLGRTNRVCAARGHHPRDFRTECAEPPGDPLARLDAQQVSERRAGRRRAGGSARGGAAVIKAHRAWRRHVRRRVADLHGELWRNAGLRAHCRSAPPQRGVAAAVDHGRRGDQPRGHGERQAGVGRRREAGRGGHRCGAEARRGAEAASRGLRGMPRSCGSSTSSASSSNRIARSTRRFTVS